MDPRRHALSRLFTALFSDDELRRLAAAVRDDAGDEHDLRTALPGPHASLDMLAHETADALERRGLVTHALFEQLLAARPQQSAAISAARHQLLPGAPLEPGAQWANGRYTLQHQLGEGGYAEVWQAIEVATGGLVALKILTLHASSQPRIVAMFRRGATVLAHLHHRSLVHVREPFLSEGERIYCVMDHVPGRTLAEAAADVSVPLDRLLDAVLQAGEALAPVHERRVVHRDISPNNILVPPLPPAVLIDFDLAGGAAFKPWSNTVPIGTIPYVAPELLDGDDATPAADVYGLAMTTLFVLLRGDLRNSELLLDRARVLEHADIPFAMRAALRDALERDVERRTATVAAFCRALEHARQHPDPGPPSPTFAADGTLELWTPADEPPPALAEKLRLWPAEHVHAHLREDRRTRTDLDRFLRHASLLQAAAVLAARGWRPAFIGLTGLHTPVFVLPGGHLVLHDDGLPEPEDLQLARAHARVPGLPVAIVRGGTPATDDVVELSQQIRRAVHDEPRLRRLERFIKSPEAHAGFEPRVREGHDAPTSAVSKLFVAFSGPALLCLRGALGSGKSHTLKLIAAHLARLARTRGGPAVVLIDATGWRPPLRWPALLCERGYTAAEAAAIQLAVLAGESILLVDGLDAPGVPLDRDTHESQLRDALSAASSPAARILLAIGTTLPSPVERIFELCPITYTDLSLAHDGGPADEIRQFFEKRSWTSYLELPALALPLAGLAALPDAEILARHTDILEQYIHSWIEHSARLAPGLTPDDLRDMLEVLAADLWFDRIEVTPDSLPTLKLPPSIPHDAVASLLTDGALLGRKSRHSFAISYRDRFHAKGPVMPFPDGKPDTGLAANTWFIHDDIFLWLLANHISRRLAAGDDSVLRGDHPDWSLIKFCKLTSTWTRARDHLLTILVTGSPAECRESALLLISREPTVASTPERPWQLAGIRMTQVGLFDVHLTGADLTRASLRKTVLVDIDLTDADLTGADLSNTFFSARCDRAAASRADFRGADLNGVSWRGANLEGANFAASRADFPMDFTDANVDGIDTAYVLWAGPIGLADPPPTLDLPADILSPLSLAWIREARWTRDGRRLVTIDSMGNLGVWSTDRYRPLARWRATEFGYTHLELAVDDRTIVAWTEGSAARLWDLHTRTELHPGALAEVRVHTAAWAHDSLTLALLTPDGSLRTWSPTQPLHERVRVVDDAPTIQFLAGDARLAAYAPAAGTFIVHDLLAGRTVSESVLGPENPNHAGFAVSPHGDRIAFRDWRTLHFHALGPDAAPTPGKASPPPMPDRLGDGPAIDWSPDGAWVVVALERGPCLWDVARERFSHYLADGATRWSCLRFSPDSRKVVGVREGIGDLALWDTVTGRIDHRPRLANHWIHAAALAADRRTLTIASARRVRRIDPKALQPGPGVEYRDEYSVALAPSADAFVRAVDRTLVLTLVDPARDIILDRCERIDSAAWDRCHFNCDGRFLVCRVSDGERHELVAWDRAGQQLFTANLAKGALYQTHTVAASHSVGICGGQTSPGGAILDLHTRGGIKRIKHPGMSIYQLALDAEERLLASAAQGNRIVLWDLPRCLSDATPAPIGELTTDWPLIEQLRFTPRGHLLAAASGEAVYLYDCDTQQRLHKFTGHSFRVHSVAFSSDARHLLAGDWSGQLRVWSITSGELVTTFHVPAKGGIVVTHGGRCSVVDGEPDLHEWFGTHNGACHPLTAFPAAVVKPHELVGMLPWDA